MELYLALLTNIVIGYLIYQEIKKPRKSKDLFVDLSINIIIFIIIIFNLFSIKFDYSNKAFLLFLLAIIEDVILFILVLIHTKKLSSKEEAPHDTNN